jgi:hypothetical protein
MALNIILAIGQQSATATLLAVEQHLHTVCTVAVQVPQLLRGLAWHIPRYRGPRQSCWSRSAVHSSAKAIRPNQDGKKKTMKAESRFLSPVGAEAPQ